MSIRFFLIFSMVSLAGCTSFPVAVAPGAETIDVGDRHPGPNYSLIGPITAKHGWGCGLYGSEGNFEGAMNVLRNKAAERRADYVQIINQQGEQLIGACLAREFKIDGMAFRKR